MCLTIAALFTIHAQLTIYILDHWIAIPQTVIKYTIARFHTRIADGRRQHTDVLSQSAN